MFFNKHIEIVSFNGLPLITIIILTVEKINKILIDFILKMIVGDEFEQLANQDNQSMTIFVSCYWLVSRL